VWNRQRKDEVLLDVQDVALGFTTKQRWNQPAVVRYVRKNVSEGGLEPLAYILGGSSQPWLSV